MTEMSGHDAETGGHVAPKYPPRVLESPVSMECRCTQIIQLQGADGTQVPTWLILGEVVMVHIDQSLLENGIFQTARARPLLRAGGPGDYFSVSMQEYLEMRRPR